MDTKTFTILQNEFSNPLSIKVSILFFQPSFHYCFHTAAIDYKPMGSQTLLHLFPMLKQHLGGQNWLTELRHIIHIMAFMIYRFYHFLNCRIWGWNWKPLAHMVLARNWTSFVQLLPNKKVTFNAYMSYSRSEQFVYLS